MTMKHISEIISKKPPLKKAATQRKKAKGGNKMEKKPETQLERYARTNVFVMPKEKRAKTGRPPVITEATIRKLEEAFVYDVTVEAACLYAGISQNTYYEFVKKYPAFKERIAQLREAPILVATQVVMRQMQSDGDLALKTLERINKKVWSTRSEVAHSGEIVDRHTIDPEQAELIHKAMGNFATKISKLTAAQIAHEKAEA